jgi:hypothetical protein
VATKIPLLCPRFSALNSASFLVILDGTVTGGGCGSVSVSVVNEKLNEMYRVWIGVWWSTARATILIETTIFGKNNRIFFPECWSPGEVSMGSVKIPAKRKSLLHLQHLEHRVVVLVVKDGEQNIVRERIILTVYICKSVSSVPGLNTKQYHERTQPTRY